VLDADSTVDSLTNDVLHYSVRDAQHHARMIAERYAPLSALHSYREGKKTGPLRLMIAGWSAFVRSYVFKLGLLDGMAGYSIAIFAAHNARLKHLILRELISKADKTPLKSTT
jgi:hypothetical protein